MNILRTETFRILVAEQFLLLLPGGRKRIIPGPEKREICYVHGSIQNRHCLWIKLAPDIGIGEKENAFGMVYQSYYTVWMKVRKKRDNNRLIGINRIERNSPMS